MSSNSIQRVALGCVTGLLLSCATPRSPAQPSPPDIQAAAKAGTLEPNDDTNQNPSYASAAGGVISTANDLVTWIQALVGGRLFNPDHQRRWLDSIRPEDPGKPTASSTGTVSPRYASAQAS